MSQLRTWVYVSAGVVAAIAAAMLVVVWLTFL